MGPPNGVVSSGAEDVPIPIALHADDEIQPPRSPIAQKTTALDVDTMKEVGAPVPTHPILSMQGAFAESMREASENATSSIPKPKLGDAAARRQILIEQAASDETHAARWGQRPGQQYHPLWKLMAQISFGIYLLLNGIAKDDEQVMSILQGHVDEVDEFLETTLEDFDLAQYDITERLRLLKLPLENIDIFDGMLEDRDFRLRIITGNEKIEHVITRTERAMRDALKDVQQGMDACKEFTLYLAEEQDETWRDERPDMETVFDAMKGNVDGWCKACGSLQKKGNALGVALVQLGSMVAEMDRRAGEVSRKARFSTTSESSPTSQAASSPPHPSKQTRQSIVRITPPDADMTTEFQEHKQDPEPAVRESYLDLDSDSEEEEEEKETEYILAPRTYTPIPPRQPSPARVQQATPPPETKSRNSLRQRFSLNPKEVSPGMHKHPTSRNTINNNDDYWDPQTAIFSVAENVQTHRNNRTTITSQRHIPPITVPTPHELEAVVPPPSRGMDSAYCSDLEKPFSPPSVQSAYAQTPNLGSHRISGSPRIVAPPVMRDHVPSPRSAHQFFRPVNASPHSPLQRPWTAAPASHHTHNHSNLSNLSKLSNGSATHLPPPSSLGNRRAAPSAMGLSTMSDITTVTENGQKLKKKRSAFGWLKKAFALSEEEKQAFEERRRRTDQENLYYERPQQKWIDGKRVR